jgi:ethanolamine utilization protein EutQ
MKKEFRIFRRADAQLAYPSGAEAGNSLFRALDETMSDTIGGGYFSFNRATDSAVLPYDEVSVCIEGALHLTVDGETHVLKPGDLVFMPKGTEVTFGGDKAVAAYAVWPVDWRQRG